MLSVPLSVSRTHYDDGLPQQSLKIWANGELHTVAAPLRPYLISLKPLRLDYPDMETEEITVKLLNDFTPRKAYKYSFDFVEAIQDLNNLTKLGKNHIPELAHCLRENRMPFTERVAADVPDFYTQYPEKLDSIYCLDLETLNKDFIDQNRIIAIGQSDNKETWCNIGKEGQILEDFRNDWKRCDPDVVVTYNGKDFDFPYLIKRMNAHNIPIDFIHRDNEVIKEPQRIHKITGRLMYDVFENVFDDQQIRLKNFKLKTVAREHFKIPAIEEDLSGGTDYLLNDPERLVKYCESDVNTTLEIFNTYLQQSVGMSNEISYPIDNLTNPLGSKDGLMKSSDGRAKSGLWTLISRIVMARGMNEIGYIENGSNREKYPFMTKFQGGFSGNKLKGRYGNIFHVDYGSMYPSIQRSFNISADTTKIDSYEDYNPDSFIVKDKTDEYILFCIPDKNIGKNVIIKVDLTREGIMPIFLSHLATERGKYKNERDDSKTKQDKEKYNSLQSVMKVLANGTGFGSNMPPNVRYGDSSVGIVITGIGRYLIFKSIDFLEERGYPCTNYDTDGTFHLNNKNKPFTNEILNELNEYIRNLIIKLGARDTKLVMELTPWEGIYIHKTKNYFLWNKDKEIKVVGSAFRSSKQAGYVDKFVDNMAQLIIDDASSEEKTELIKRAMRIDKYSLEDLTLHTRPTKMPNEFKNNNIGKRLMLAAQRQLNIPAVPYTTYEYVHGIKGEMLTARAEPKLIDYEKYRQLLSKKCANFAMEEIAQRYIKTPGLVELKQEIW